MDPVTTTTLTSITFKRVLRFAERVRPVGDGRSKTQGRSIQYASRRLAPGSEIYVKDIASFVAQEGRCPYSHVVLGDAGY